MEPQDTITLNVNGEGRVVRAGISLHELISISGYDPGKVLASMNGEIVGIGSYPKTFLRDGDSIDLFCFVGGG